MCFIKLAELAREIESDIDEAHLEKLDAVYNDLISEWKLLQLVLEHKE